jgi:hypothetical protein
MRWISGFGLFLALALMLAAPAAAQDQAPPQGPAVSDSDAPATLYLYRTNRFLCSAWRHDLYVGQAAAVEFRYREYVKAEVRPGIVAVRVDLPRGIEGCDVELRAFFEMRPGETYYVELGVQGLGALTLRPGSADALQERSLAHVIPLSATALP